MIVLYVLTIFVWIAITLLGCGAIMFWANTHLEEKLKGSLMALVIGFTFGMVYAGVMIGIVEGLVQRWFGN